MSKLGDTLQKLLDRAAQTGETQQWALAKGLNCRVAANPARLCLWRDAGHWGPGEASEREGHTGAKHLGWTSYTLSWSGKYLVVTEEAAPVPAPLPTNSQKGTCGTCANGIPSEDAGMIDCLLGWEAHDGLWSEHQKKIVALGHGEALLPSSSPACRCGATVGHGYMGWTPKLSTKGRAV